MPGLLAAVKSSPQSRPPDIAPVFARVSAAAPPSERAALGTLQKQLDSIIQRAATHAFKRPLLYAALFALAVLPLLGFGLIWTRRLPRS